VLYAFVASSFVLFVSLLIQWVVYDDWLHKTGPLRIVGTVIAALITFFFVLPGSMSFTNASRRWSGGFK
jgi:hypothetical protein